MSGRIVVGADGSVHSNAALRWAISLAEKLGDTTVVALFSWQLPLIEVPGAFDREEMEARAKQYLVGVVDQVARTAPVPVDRIVAEGDPTGALVEAAKDADLLVLGSRGRAPVMGSSWVR